MSIKELADAAGVSASAICRYESGKRTPNVMIAKRIGAVLDIPWFAIVDNRSSEDGDKHDQIPDDSAGG